MPSLFADNLRKFDGLPAIVEHNGKVWTFEKLDHTASDFAAKLGTDRHLVLIECANQIEPIIAYLGALKAGFPVILQADGATAKDSRIVSTFSPRFIFHRVDGKWQLDEQAASQSVDLHPDLALLMSTSGSTGSPKLVRLSRSNIQNNAEAIASFLELAPVDRAISSLPFHYCYGLSVLHSHLASGSSIYLTERSVIEPQFWHLFTEFNCTHFAGVPCSYELLERIRFEQMHLPTLKCMTQAGGKLSSELVQKHARLASDHGYQFFVMYGQTEATARMAYMPADIALQNPDAVGSAIPGGKIFLKDSAGQHIKRPNKQGELVFEGPSVMMGYANRTADLVLEPMNAPLHTGDLAVRNRSGVYRITGRTSRFAKMYGNRLSLDEMELFLRKSGYNVAVAGDDSLITICTTSECSPAQLKKLVKSKFRVQRSNVAVWQVAEIPRLKNQKIDYRKILLEGRKLPTKPAETAPQTPRFTFDFTKLIPSNS